MGNRLRIDRRGSHIRLDLAGLRFSLRLACRLQHLLTPTQHGELSDGDYAEQVTRRCIGRVNNTDSDRVVDSTLEIKVCNGKALSGTHTDMDLLIALVGFDAD